MLENARDRSATLRLLTAISTRLESAVRRSRITALGRLIRRYVMASFCYRWLTAEPDPEVIVIDLRDTKTVGPIIAVLDRLLAGLARATATSAIAAGATTVAAHGRERPIAVAGLVALPAIAVSLIGLAAAGTLTTPLLVGHLLATALAALGCRSQQSLAELRETKTARVLAAAFEPPAPPEPESQQPMGRVNADRDADRRGRDPDRGDGSRQPSAAANSAGSDTPDESADGN